SRRQACRRDRSTGAMTMGFRPKIGILIIAIAGLTGTLYAQTGGFATAALSGAEPATQSVRLFVGRSAIVDVGTPISRLALARPAVADGLGLRGGGMLVNGKAPGTIWMLVWERAGNVRRYEVDVRRDLDRLTNQVKQLFPNESVDVRGNGRQVVLSGTVST